jgi:3-hydroxyisobutyrate dehydrogenase
VGVIGLGMMGSQIALTLGVKGHNVTVFNIDQKLLTNGTTNLKIAIAKELGDSSDIAIVCVKDYQAVKNVSFMTGGLIETTNADLVVIQCSTISPDESSKIADLYSKKQIKLRSGYLPECNSKEDSIEISVCL